MNRTELKLDQLEKTTMLEWYNRGTSSPPQNPEAADVVQALQFQGHPDHIQHFLEYVSQYQPPQNIKLTPIIYRQNKTNP
jgi:hypothetical protein